MTAESPFRAWVGGTGNCNRHGEVTTRSLLLLEQYSWKIIPALLEGKAPMTTIKGLYPYLGDD